jgi:hypothetical protein
VFTSSADNPSSSLHCKICDHKYEHTELTTFTEVLELVSVFDKRSRKMVKPHFCLLVFSIPSRPESWSVVSLAEPYETDTQLYTAFKLLSSDFVDGPLRDAKPYKVFTALGAMTVGLIAMAVLGKWA